ncbi:MAG: urate hydroxylase PuuD [Gaiellaceae bacterium]
MANVVALNDYWWQWGNLLFRWLHVIAAIAWIGGSFYFIALDNHLEPPRDPRDADRGIGGEAWEIHGGGFYRVEKFVLAPARLPERLHWFKWEAYTTWLSGFALMIVVYYAHASSFLIDTTVADLSSWEAIALSAGGLALAWLVYDALCRTFPDDEGVLAVLVFAFVCASAYASWRLFAPRAAYLQVGAMIGTMMVGNVFFVIIPAHWKLVRAKEASRPPDPRWNKSGKTRSVHNNYLTLPVLFAMLSNHFPFTYGHANGWIVLVALMAIGAVTRHYFNLRHRGLNVWPILLLAGAGIVAVALVLRP